MKILITISAIILSLITTPLRAAEPCDTINVKVNGMVCDFCARALEKVFSKQESVADINVDLDNGEVVIGMKPGKTIDDETLKRLITDSGYDVRTIEKDC